MKKIYLNRDHFTATKFFTSLKDAREAARKDPDGRSYVVRAYDIYYRTKFLGYVVERA